MTPQTITLRNERTDRDSRHLWARVTGDGDLTIEGADRGPSVARFWGEGHSEYEWVITVRAAHVPTLIAALGGSVGDQVLPLPAARFGEDERYVTKGFFEERGVPIEFWSRVGD